MKTLRTRSPRRSAPFGIPVVFAALRKFESARFGPVRCEKRASNGYPPGKAPFRICPSCANALVVPNGFDTNLKPSKARQSEAQNSEKRHKEMNLDFPSF